MDLRCPGNKKHGMIVGGLIEVKCDSRFCGARSGVTVLHRFNSSTGELVETQKFKDPGKEQKNGTLHNPASVRSAGH